MRPSDCAAVLTRPSGTKVGDVAPHLAHIAASTRENRPPARMWPADKVPDLALQQTYREHISNPDVHGLLQEPAVGAHAECLGVEDGYAHGVQPEHA